MARPIRRITDPTAPQIDLQACGAQGWKPIDNRNIVAYF
jgi:hypothetical protein